MANANTLSILLKLSGTRGLIIGKDERAEKWARYAAAQEAEIRLIHPKPSESFLAEQAALKCVHLFQRDFEEEDLKDRDWLITSLPDPDACDVISRLSKRYRVWSAFLCFPEMGSFVLPRAFTFDSGQILVSWGSADPFASEEITKTWLRFLPPDFFHAFRLLRSIEERLYERIPNAKHHARVLASLQESHFFKLTGTGRWDDAAVLAEKVIQSYALNPERRHRVSPRVGVDLEIQFCAELQHHTGKIFNLSRDGAFIATPVVFPRLTHITSVQFALPTRDVISNAEGFVVWENSPLHPRVPIYPPGFALMFESLSQENLNAIEQHVLSQLK